MARVTLIWELGGGFGHLVRYRALVERLLEQGHRVVFHAAAEARAKGVYADSGIDIRPAPRGRTSAQAMIPNPNSLAEVLWNSGYSDPAQVRVRVQHWLRVLADEQPDVVIADYAPSAVMACKVMGLRCFAAGNGFYVPAHLSPQPAYRRAYDAQPRRLDRHEAKLLEVLNAALLGLQGRDVRTVAEALLPAEAFLMTFPEFDFMPRPAGTDYLGAWPSTGFGSCPTFPEGSPRIFIYANVNETFFDLLSVLSASNASILLVCRPGSLNAQLPRNMNNVKVNFDLVDFSSAAAACDAGVTSGTLNATLGFLLSGKPVLALPSNLEQYLNARQLERLGAGLSAPSSSPGNLAAKAGALLMDHDLHREARRFAARYAGQSQAGATERMLARLALPL